MRSLQARLLFSSAIVLTVFLMILAFALDHSFRTQKLSDIASRLNIYVQSVLAQIEVKDRYSLCKPLTFIGDAGFNQRRNASLYGIITNTDDTVIWKSTSTKKTQDDFKLPFLGKARLGKLTQKVLANDKHREFIAVSYRAQIDVVSCDVEESMPVMPENTDRNAGQVMHHHNRQFEPGNKSRMTVTRPGPKHIPPQLPRVNLHGSPESRNSSPGASRNEARVVEIVIKITEALDAKHERFEHDKGSEKKNADNDRSTLTGKAPVNPEVVELNSAFYSFWGEAGVDQYTVDLPPDSGPDLSNDDNGVILHTYYDDLRQFRVTLAMGFVAVLGVYLFLFTMFLRLWGLMPMRKVAQELDNIKAGAAEKLTGLYPAEILGLTDSINRLIISERAQQERYRNSLGDLAHSLKTPLAVLVGAAEQKDLPGEFKKDMQDQVLRMRQIIDYQLQRAAAGRTTLTAPVHVGKSLQRLANTLFKAYAEKNVKYTQEVEPGVVFLGDEGDFLEMFGNLMENAFKWCGGEVTVKAFHHSGNDKFQLEIEVHDNGPGVPEDKIQSVLTRGFRVDEAVSGQGIGLSVVKEIIHAYKGKLEIGKSELGGAKFGVLI